ncbi:hypothetical protein ACFQ7F_19165 [Streptomyces sp. NPDC056486]|uniref:hypothetical protein n=1 Tax=Streptomyces sp. NPDC056486 TaxID=3345835 RepID=UPI003674FAA4
MTAASSPRYPDAEAGQARDTYAARQTQSETKPSFKTSEMFAYVASVIAVLIASLAVGDGSDGVDRFPADQAWLYVTLLTIGYLVSRGLAKSGSRETTDTTRR